MVTYINYNLIILAILVMMAVILVLVRGPNRAAKTRRREAELERKLAKVPTPWGWPRCASILVGGNHLITANGLAHSFSASFYHWADRLVQEKHTVDNFEYRHKREGCIRALLEDRYGQMDHSTGGRADKIEARFLRKQQVGAISPYRSHLRPELLTGLKDLKMPWGW